MTDVVLVQMPFAAIEHPSIALGVLCAVLRRDGISCRALYPNLDFCERLGVERYHTISVTMTEDMLGEWCFSPAAFPEHEGDASQYLAGLTTRGYKAGSVPVDELHAMLFEARREATAFVDETARRILAMRPRIVGCSSIFQQHCASLALLRRLRELDPSIVTLLGGANCEAEMGVAAAKWFPWVDFVVSGEAENLVTPLCRSIFEHGRGVPTDQLPYGVLTADPVTHQRPGPRGYSGAPRAAVERFDDVPTPDYDDWFEAFVASPLHVQAIPGLLVETSRGCWWGQKHHCTFCGLNGLGLGYRAKSPQHVLDEFEALSSRYRIKRFEVVDNILDNGHMNTVLPRLAEQNAGYTFFYETKSNLKREQMRTLASAGVYWIQPGIESLHDEVLTLMDKGTTTMVNLQLLKWAREFGVRVAWNFLVGFPGERDEWYAEMAEWLPLLEHLQPPSGVMRMRYDRFSLYHQDPERFGVSLVPNKSYAHVYPLPPEGLAELAYFFEDAPQHADREDRDTFTPGRRALRVAVKKWMEAFWSSRIPPLLSVRDDGDTLSFFDVRRVAVERRWSCDGLCRLVYRACETAQTPTSIVSSLRRTRPETQEAEVSDAIAELTRRRLVLAWRGKVLALGVHGHLPSLPDRLDFPGGYPHAPPAAVARATPQPLWLPSPSSQVLERSATPCPP